jgi:hypothetical protein
MVLPDVPVLVSNGRRWAAVPGKAVVDAETGQQKVAAGKRVYVPAFKWRSWEISDRFSDAVVALVAQHYPEALSDGAGGILGRVHADRHAKERREALEDLRKVRDEMSDAYDNAKERRGTFSLSQLGDWHDTILDALKAIDTEDWPVRVEPDTPKDELKQPGRIVTVPNGQRYEMLSVKEHACRDGHLTLLALWRSNCAECDCAFTFQAPSHVQPANRRCELHKAPGKRVKVPPAKTLPELQKLAKRLKRQGLTPSQIATRLARRTVP